MSIQGVSRFSDIVETLSDSDLAEINQFLSSPVGTRFRIALREAGRVDTAPPSADTSVTRAAMAHYLCVGYELFNQIVEAFMMVGPKADRKVEVPAVSDDYLEGEESQ